MSVHLDFSLMKKFVNLLMVNGKKNLAYKIFSQGGDQFLRSLEDKQRTVPFFKPLPVQLSPATRIDSSKEGVEKKPFGNKAASKDVNRYHQLSLCLRTAVNNVQPALECKKCRIAGTTRLIPAVVSDKRGMHLAVRWMIESARIRKSRSNDPFYQCLAQELLDAYNKQGRPRQQREQFHKMAEGNRGYLRYRWW